MGKTFARPVIADGRITIPARVRDELGIERGDYVKVDMDVIEDE